MDENQLDEKRLDENWAHGSVHEYMNSLKMATHRIVGTIYCKYVSKFLLNKSHRSEYGIYCYILK